MPRLMENDWYFINTLIYNIFDINDFEKMRLDFLTKIRLLIPYDRATFYLANSHPSFDHYLQDPVGIGFTKESLYQYFDEFEEIDFMKWIYPMSVCDVYRQTDLFNDEERHRSPYFIRAYAPLDIEYAMILSLSYDKRFMGVVSLYRSAKSKDFSDKELTIMKILKDHLALRLYKNSNEISTNTITEYWEQCVDKIIVQHHLTKTEGDILNALLRGETNENICASHFISNSTLKKHTSNIYKKIGIKKRIELFKIFIGHDN